MTTHDARNLIAAAAVLVVTDLRRSVDWYVNKLAFRCAVDWSTNPTFLIVQRQGASIMLKQAEEASQANRTLTPGLDLFDAYIWVRDITSLHYDLLALNTPIHSGPAKRPHGCTELSVISPDNHLICFGFCP